jgi:hypothetical protein
MLHKFVHCAGKKSTYGQYTLLDAESGHIVCSLLIDRRETNGSAITMELFGFLRATYELIEKGVHISKIITDEHVQVRKFFREFIFLIICFA